MGVATLGRTGLGMGDLDPVAHGGDTFRGATRIGDTTPQVQSAWPGGSSEIARLPVMMLHRERSA